MPDPVPTAMDVDQITAITMDCIVRAQELDPEIDADDQKSQSNLTIESDAKLLWKQPRFPYRAISFIGTRDNLGPSIASFYDGFGMISDSTFDGVPWGYVYEFEFTPGTGGHDGTYALASSGSSVMSGVDPTPYAWSVWGWGTPSGDVPVNSTTPIYAFIMQVLCPNPIKVVPYEIWSVTARPHAPTAGGGFPGDVPEPYPWSDSSDFSKIGSGTMHPGQIITLPCLVAQAPQAPPAPPSFSMPYSEPYWNFWGVATYIVFPP